MGKPAYTGVEMSVSPLSAYRKMTDLVVEASGCRQQYPTAAEKNIVRVQGNLTARRYKDDDLQPYMLNVIDRQRKTFQQDNFRPLTATVTMDVLSQNNINVFSLKVAEFDPNISSLGQTW